MLRNDEYGSPSFYTPENLSPVVRRKMPAQKPRRISTVRKPVDPSLENGSANTDGGLPVVDERDMIMDLVMDIAMDLDVTSVSHRILQVMNGCC